LWDFAFTDAVRGLHRSLSGSPMWDVDVEEVTRHPGVNLLYSYLLSLCRIYRRTAA
jgi:hypothetical protein